MRTIALLLYGLLAAPITFAATPWEEYVSFPSPKNAELVKSITYSSQNSELVSDFAVLEAQVVSGDIESLRLALRLAQQADGGELHDLQIILSRAIRPHPEKFLSLFEQNASGDEILKRSLFTVGEEYVDRPKARKYELIARLSALRHVQVEGDPHRYTHLHILLMDEIDDLSWHSQRTDDR